MDARKKKLFAPLPAGLLAAARDLRKHLTDAEQLLWFYLRRRQLAGYRFRRQHPFERYVLDFYCVEAALAVELDGGQHNEDGVALYDTQRTAFLMGRGVAVVRTWNDDIFKNPDGVLLMIYEALLVRSPSGGGIPPP